MLTEALDAIFDAILINTKKMTFAEHIIGTGFAIRPAITINITEPKPTPL